MTRMKDSGIEWIGEVPEEWGIVRLKDCLEINNGKDYKDIETDETGYPVIGSGGQFAYARKYLHDGTAILLGRKGTIDKPLYIEGKFWTVDTMFYSVPKSGIHAKFIYYVALQIPFGLYSTNTALPSMTQTDLQNHHFVMPPLDEQTQIADFLDKKVAQLDKVKSLLEEQIKTLEDYRQSLIYETVTKGLDKTVPLKESGVDWIGQIPEGWGVKRLKNILSDEKDNMKVGPFGSALSGNDIKSFGKKWVYNQRTVLDNNFITTDSFIDDTKWEELKSFSVKAGDVLLTTRGTIGKIAIVPENNQVGIIHPCLIRFRLNEGMLSGELLKYIFNDTDLVKNQLHYLSNSTTIDVIYSYNLKNIFLPVFPESVQNKITDFLKREIARINQMIAIKKEQIENINKQRQTLIYDYVTGKRRV